MTNPGVRAYATLSIHSSKLSAKNIADLMQVQNGKLQEAGQPVSLRPGAKLAEHSIWQLSSRLQENVSGLDEGEPIERHIEYIVEMLEKAKAAIEILKSDCEFDIWCLLSFEKSNHGLTLEQSLIHRLSQFPANLIFDLYSSGD